MNVFILSTGRCGSTTFERACSHIDNYSAGHETRAHIIGKQRLNYPNQHIESDNRLAWFLGRLEQHYPQDVFYVHLQRDPALVAKSYSQRWQRGMMMPAYSEGIYLGLADDKQPISLDIAGDYVNTVNHNISLFLKHKDNQMEFHLESAKQDFSTFWQRIHAQGDLNAALAEFDIHYNASKITT